MVSGKMPDTKSHIVNEMPNPQGLNIDLYLLGIGEGREYEITANGYGVFCGMGAENVPKLHCGATHSILKTVEVYILNGTCYGI